MNIDLTSLALGWIAAYGAPMVAGLLFLSGLGVPLPATLLVIASGAFMRQNLLDAWTTPLLGYFSVVSGDVLLYLVGFFARAPILARFGHTAAWNKANQMFKQRGGIAIYFTRWLLTALAMPTVLIAGSSGYQFRKFLMYDALGELTWFLLFGGLGYAFGSQWELISGFISDFSGFLTGALVMGVGVYLFIRFGRKQNNPATAVQITTSME